MGQKYRDRLLSAAMHLSDDPTKTLAFLDVADEVIAEIQEQQQSREARLNVALEQERKDLDALLGVPHPRQRGRIVDIDEPEGY